jgi:hypothetical protein
MSIQIARWECSAGPWCGAAAGGVGHTRHCTHGRRVAGTRARARRRRTQVRRYAALGAQFANNSRSRYRIVSAAPAAHVGQQRHPTVTGVLTNVPETDAEPLPA